MNPRAVAFMWALTMLMAAAIALGPVYIYVSAGIVVAYTIYAVLP